MPKVFNIPFMRDTRIYPNWSGSFLVESKSSFFLWFLMLLSKSWYITKLTTTILSKINKKWQKFTMALEMQLILLTCLNYSIEMLILILKCMQHCHSLLFQHIKWTLVVVGKIQKIWLRHNHNITKYAFTFCLSVPQHSV